MREARGWWLAAAILLSTSCGGSVVVGETGASTGAGGGSASSSSAGGAGGTAALPPPACGLGEGAILAAADDVQGVVATFLEGAWTYDASFLLGAADLASFVAIDHRPGVLWTDHASPEAHFAVTADGTHFDETLATGWEPGVAAGLAAVEPGLVSFDEDGAAALERLDPTTLAWSAYLPPAPFAASSIAPPGAGDFVAVGVSGGVLCSSTASAGAWGPVLCRSDVPAYTEGAEINLTPPIAVTLQDGDVVVVYAPSPVGDIAATTLHDGTWSAPDTLSAPGAGGQFAAAATSVGDAIVVTGGSTLAAFRYAPGAGWGSAIPLGAASGTGAAVATGVCGDDALVAFRDADDVEEVRVARVRGSLVAPGTVVDLGAQVYEWSLATMGLIIQGAPYARRFPSP